MRLLAQLRVALAQPVIGQCSRLVSERIGRIDDALELLETLALANAKELIEQVRHRTNPTSLYLSAA